MSQAFRLLIVDDNQGFVDRMAGMLLPLQHVTVQSAGSYAEAIGKLVKEEPDMVLLDISLPDRNGISLLKKIKELGHESEVVMISNSSSQFYRDKCRQLGARAFLDKTGEFERVPQLIAESGLRPARKLAVNQTKPYYEENLGEDKIGYQTNGRSPRPLPFCN